MICLPFKARSHKKLPNDLHAKLSASEKASIEERPTQDLVAYDFYVRAVSMIYNAQVPFTSSGCGNCPATEENPSWKTFKEISLPEAVELLNKAVARDPNFFLAYCQLAFAHDLIGKHPRALGPGKVGHRFCISVEAGFGGSAPGAGVAPLLGLCGL